MTNMKIRYPKRHFLKELKQLLRNNKAVKIEMKPLLGKNRLRKSVSEYINNQGFSFVTSWFFLLHMRLLYALLVLDIHNYVIKLDEGYVLHIKKAKNEKGLENNETESETGSE